MGVKSKIYGHLFFLILGAAYTFAVSGSILASTDLVVPAQRVLTLCVFAVLVFYIYFFNKYTAVFFSVLLIFVSGFVFFNLYLNGFETPWFTALGKYLNEMYSFVRGFTPYDGRFDLTIASLIIFSSALVCAVNIKVKFRFILLALLGFAVMLIPLIMNYESADLPVYGVVFAFCFLVFLVKRLNLTAKSGMENAKLSLIFIPICAGVVFISNLLPSFKITDYSSEASAPGPVRTAYFGPVRDFFYETFNPSSFSFQNTGFMKRDGTLGGNVSANGNFVMEVYSGARVYLSGAVKDYYSGVSWENTVPGGQDIVSDGNRHILTAYGTPYAESDVKTVKIDIGTARTRTVFLPPYPESAVFSHDVELYKNGAGDVSARRFLAKYANYTVSYTGVPGAANGVAAEIPFAYRQLPESLPERVYDLAYGITRGMNSDMDKMKALEDYLRGFRYTLEPGDVPEGRDFVDYFLFDGKEGYCTYYASALTVMARCAGIPARYLEGYVMPKDRNRVGAFEVTNYDAHAWTEGYIDGVWTAFEPTAPFAYSEETQVPPRSVFSEVMYDVNPYYEEYMRRMGFTQPLAAPPPEEPAPAVSGFDEEMTRLEFWLTLFLAFLAFLLFLSVILSVRALARFLMFRRLDRAGNRDAVIAYFKRMLNIADVYTYPIMENETVYTYSERIGKRFAFENETVFMSDLAGIFSKASYSKNTVSDAERLMVRRCYYEFLEMLLMYRMFRIQFFFHKYVIAKI